VLGKIKKIERCVVCLSSLPQVGNISHIGLSGNEVRHGIETGEEFLWALRNADEKQGRTEHAPIMQSILTRVSEDAQLS
jgi:hypothetical protein